MDPKDHNVNLKPHKSQICRFYLRGLCILKTSECYYAHGVWDLNFAPYTQGEHIEYDYSKVDKESKQTIIKGPRNYVNLYEYQKEKIFTLSELNEDGAKRRLIRNEMHAEMFNEFIELLMCYYPEDLFTESFLVREFTRVGFNKTMSVIKISHISAFVCDHPDSRFYVISTVLPPKLKTETNILIVLAPEEQMLNFYKESYEDYMADNKGVEVTQNQVKKFLFSVYRPTLSILPLNLLLKKKKMNFTTFIKLITNESIEIVMEADQQTLLKAAASFIEEKVEKGEGYCSWNDVYKFLGSEFKVNNANITNPLKPQLIEMGFVFLNFPMLQMVSKLATVHKWKCEGEMSSKTQSVCECPYKEMYAEEALMLDIMGIEETQLPPKESLDIFDLPTLLKCAPHILSSKVLGVDIEGRLRKNGFIEMIQLNNGRNTFLIDVYRMLMQGEVETFELTKKILRNVLCNGEVLKIFHDCRHDTLVLHEIVKSCVLNIFDTSAVETLIGQLEVYGSEKDCAKALKHVANVKTPGLNEILKKYHAPHGINKNKDWFHQLWKKGHTELFELRPLDPQYREYCIKDVLDLPYVHMEMSQQLCPGFTNWLCSHYVRAGYQYTLEGQEK